MQVYRELRILTARPGAEDEARAPHALYGFVSGARGLFGRALRRRRRHGHRRGQRGGPRADHRRRHRALLQGAARGPVAGPGRRSRRARLLARARPRAGRRPSCTRSCAQRDPEMAARLMPTDPQRIVRALEVLDSTGRSLADWQREPGEPVLAESRDRAPAACCPTAQATARGHRRPLRRHAGGRRARRRCARCWRSASPTELPIMRALGRGAAGRASRRRAVAGGGRRGGQGRDAASTPSGS